jgi:hypothetical protein
VDAPVASSSSWGYWLGLNCSPVRGHHHRAASRRGQAPSQICGRSESSMYFALPLCLGSTRSFEALALGAAWGVGRLWRHRADRAPAQLGRGEMEEDGPLDVRF